MNSLVAGIGEFKVSNHPDDVIKTFALGSCIAIIMFDKVNLVGGLIHFALPESSVSPEKAKVLPGYFADTGIPLFIEEMKKAGMVQKFTTIKLAGGASVLDESHSFDIGRRNLLAAKKILWKYSMGITAEDVGGTIARTVFLHVGTGELILSSSGKKWNL